MSSGKLSDVVQNKIDKLISIESGNEIEDNLFLGDKSSASSGWLAKHKITHVLSMTDAIPAPDTTAYVYKCT
jgi:hypothetical protein